MRTDVKNMRDAEIRIRNFIKKNNRLPNNADMYDMDGKKIVEVPKDEMCGMFYTDYNFWLKNGRFPNWVTRNVKRSDTMILNIQDDAFTCCPASLSTISAKLFNPKSEKTLADIFGTIHNYSNPGTNPKNLLDESRQKKAGFIIKQMSRNPANVANALGRYKGVLCHYETGPADCSGFVNNYGHFCVIAAVKDAYYLIYDPTRGIYKCRTSEMDKATNGRKIYYYSVENR